MGTSSPANKDHSNTKAPYAPPMTLEEFDALKGGHRFSDSYQQRKRALLAAYDGVFPQFENAAPSMGAADGKAADRAPRKPPIARVRRFSWKAALALAAALAGLPLCAWAVIDHGGFFAGAFGNSARTSVEAHDETYVYDNGKAVTATLPAREYVAADAQEAERLLGPYVSTETVPVTIGEHTLTILSAVRDADTMVVHYTLERPDGVTALQWSELTNQGKGAYQPNDEPYRWSFIGSFGGAQPSPAHSNYAGNLTLVDAERSTAEKLYCYDYLAFTEAPTERAPVALHVSKQALEGEAGDAQEGDNGGTEQIVEIPVEGIAAARTLTADGVGSIDVSPLSLRFDHTGPDDIVDERLAQAYLDKHFGNKDAEDPEGFLADCYAECDIDAIKQISVAYNDGTVYAVCDRIADLDNTAYVLAREERQTVWMFNRLVDPEAIASITINDVTFT